MSDEEKHEISKVARRLGFWAKPDRQAQYNSQILNAFLDLSASNSEITENDIFRYLGTPLWFQTNFAQMKSIAPKNHGKIFHLNESIVSIWKPVAQHVSDYQKSVRVSV